MSKEKTNSEHKNRIFFLKKKRECPREREREKERERDTHTHTHTETERKTGRQRENGQMINLGKVLRFAVSLLLLKGTPVGNKPNC